MLFKVLLPVICVAIVPCTVFGQTRIIQGPNGPVLVQGGSPQFQQQQYQPQQQQFQPQQQYQNQQRPGLGAQILRGIANQQMQSQPKGLGGQILNTLANEFGANQQGQQNFNQQNQGLQVERVQNGWASKDTFTNRNNQTGGWNTQNTHYNDSAFARGREAGKANSRYERNDVRDTNGNVIGYQEGRVWNNAQTGQKHWEMKSYTPNQSNGTHSGSSFGLTGGR